MTNRLHHAPRLYIEHPLSGGISVTIEPDQAHYLKNVMRLKTSDNLRLFNGRDGEWLGAISAVGKKNDLAVAIHERLKPQTAEPDLWLLCAPIKKAHFDYMIEKATELGVGVIQPLLTHRTQIREVNVERCRSIAIEAAEQSERLSIPNIHKPVSLNELLSNWPGNRTLIVCAEWGDAVPVKDALAKLKPAPVAILTGPEGGLAEEELDQLRKIKNSVFVRLGPRILRADTAAIAALTCWQALCGDWGKASST